MIIWDGEVDGRLTTNEGSTTTTHLPGEESPLGDF